MPGVGGAKATRTQQRAGLYRKFSTSISSERSGGWAV
jgi:hypothetical protein